MLAKVTIWLVIEITLNIAGLDNIADYSEFIFERHPVILSSLSSVMM
jgi:hypothetical protein